MNVTNHCVEIMKECRRLSDQSARIAELEGINRGSLLVIGDLGHEIKKLQANQDALTSRLEHAVKLLGEYENAIQNAVWSRSQKKYLEDCGLAITESTALLASIKPN